MKWDNMFAKQTSAMGIDMELIGGWADLAGYYKGSDGNAWAYQSGWTNQGPIAEFITRLQAGNIRGELNVTVDTGHEGIGSSRGIVRRYNPAVGTWIPI